MDERVLLCRPYNGFNDTLCQIEICYRYARRFGRTLLIEFAQDSLMEVVFEHLEFLPGEVSVEVGISKERRSQIRQMATFPPEAADQIEAFRALGGIRRTLDPSDERGTALTGLRFSYSRNYAEPLLVHQSRVGGELSFSALRRMRLKTKSWGPILAAVPRLPHTYDAMHIRATDLSSDPRALLELWRKKEDGTPLLLCSDNNLVLEEARLVLPDGILVTFPPNADSLGLPLHRLREVSNPSLAKQSATRLLAEFIAMAHSRRFFYGFVDVSRPFYASGFRGPVAVSQPFYASGFSRLVAHANAHRNKIALFQLPPAPWGSPNNGARGRSHLLMKTKVLPAWFAVRAARKLGASARAVRRILAGF